MHITNVNVTLGNLTLDIATQTLVLNHNNVLQLKPQTFELLCYFCNNQHKIVTREELISHVWHNRIVSDNAINRAVSQLRLAISQLDSDQEYIQTLPRAGYRLIVAVKSVAIDSVNTRELSSTPIIAVDAIVAAVDNDSTRQFISATRSTVNSQDTQNASPIRILYGLNLNPTLLVIMLISIVLFIGFIFLKPSLNQVSSANTTLKSKSVSYTPGAEYDANITRDWALYVNRSESEFNLVASNRHNNEMQVVYKSTDALRFPKLSPNVDLISVFIRKNEKLGLRACQLNVIDFKTLQSIKQFQCGLANVVSQQWTSTSAVQVVTAIEGRGLQVMTFDVNSEIKQLDISIPFSDERLRFISMHFSPDGKDIGLLSRNVANNQTHFNVFSVVSLESKQSIIVPSITVSGVQWLENGDVMWLDSGKLFKTDKNGLNRVEQLTDVTALTQLNTSYKGELFVSHGQSRTNLINIGNDNKEVFQVASSKDEYMPVYANNSSQFAFFSNRTGQLGLWLSDGQNKAIKITLPEQELLLKPVQWSPDDSHLVITTKSSVLVYSLVDAKVYHINVGPSKQAVWFSNNELAILKSQSVDDLILYNLQSKEERSIALPFPISNFQYVDQILYFTQKGSHDIWRYDLKTQQVNQLGVNANVELGFWQVKKDFLYYVPISLEKLHIAKRDLITNSENTIYYFNIADAAVFSISSTDQILLQRQVQDETDISAITIR